MTWSWLCLSLFPCLCLIFSLFVCLSVCLCLSLFLSPSPCAPARGRTHAHTHTHTHTHTHGGTHACRNALNYQYHLYDNFISCSYHRLSPCPCNMCWWLYLCNTRTLLIGICVVARLFSMYITLCLNQSCTAVLNVYYTVSELKLHGCSQCIIITLCLNQSCTGVFNVYYTVCNQSCTAVLNLFFKITLCLN